MSRVNKASRYRIASNRIASLSKITTSEGATLTKFRHLGVERSLKDTPPQVLMTSVPRGL